METANSYLLIIILNVNIFNLLVKKNRMAKIDKNKHTRIQDPVPLEIHFDLNSHKDWKWRVEEDILYKWGTKWIYQKCIQLLAAEHVFFSGEHKTFSVLEVRL